MTDSSELPEQVDRPRRDDFRVDVFTMAQKPGKMRDFPTDLDHHVVLFPTRCADYLPNELPAQSAGHPGSGVLPTDDGGKVVWGAR